MSLRCSAKGSRQGVMVYSGPLPVGIHDGIHAPRGNIMKAMRRGAAPATTSPSAVLGSMASRSGNARLAPTPRRTVRREIRGDIIWLLLSFAFGTGHFEQ